MSDKRANQPLAQRIVELGGDADDALRLVGETEDDYRTRLSLLVKQLIQAGNDRGKADFFKGKSLFS